MKPFLSALCLSLSSVYALACDLHAIDPWVREAPPGAPAMAGYVTLHNMSDEAIVITRSESAAFESVEVHQTLQKDGMMSMQRLSTLEVPGGERVVLASGGTHLMLMGPQQRLRTGNVVEVDIYCGKQVQVLEMPVQRRKQSSGSAAGHHHH